MMASRVLRPRLSRRSFTPKAPLSDRRRCASSKASYSCSFRSACAFFQLGQPRAAKFARPLFRCRYPLAAWLVWAATKLTRVLETVPCDFASWQLCFESFTPLAAVECCLKWIGKLQVSLQASPRLPASIRHGTFILSTQGGGVKPTNTAPTQYITTNRK
jgi:hypothetical protein